MRSHAMVTPMFVAAAAVALVVAVHAPATTAVVGLVCFGILHNVLELRYVAGRFAGILSGTFLRLLLVFIGGIAVCRLLPSGDLSKNAEILLAYALIAIACARALRERPVALAASLVAVAGACAASLAFPAYHFVVLAHLHNVVPLFFLWEWSNSALAPRPRLAFRAVQVGWVLLLPAVILAGGLDFLLRDSPAAVADFGGGTRPHAAQALATAYTPPHWLDSAMALRFLAVFAFLQTMHYVVWVWFMPRHAPEASARFQARVPGFTNRAVLMFGVIGTALLALVFATDYASGKTVYSSVATFHAYLEFPVLLALILGFEKPAPTPMHLTEKKAALA